MQPWSRLPVLYLIFLRPDVVAAELKSLKFQYLLQPESHRFVAWIESTKAWDLEPMVVVPRK
eukprot:1538870-Rhodomonas_salina.3